MASSTASQHARVGLAVVAVLVASAFGPYLAPGIRTEQAAVYAAAVGVLTLTIARLAIPPTLAWILAAWAAYMAIVVTGAAAPPPNASRYAGGSVLSGLDNAVLPAAVMLVVAGLMARGADARQLLARLCSALVALTCVNAVSALMQLRSGVEFSAWYGGAPGTDSVSMLAAQLGRYSGLINQPAEAGVIYSLAAFCALYRFSSKPIILSASLALITIGGVLTVSKVFLLCGLPLLAIALLRLRKGRTARLATLTLVGMGAWVAVSAGYLPRWSGVDFLVRLLPGRSDESALALFTANRYESGGGGTLEGVTEAVLSGPWAFGYGAGGLFVPYDSGWVEALVVAGVAGVIAQVVVFALLWRAWATAPRSAERTLLGYALVLLVAASSGLPALTANRAATVAWLLLACLLYATSRRPLDGDPDGSSPAIGRDELVESAVRAPRVDALATTRQITGRSRVRPT